METTTDRTMQRKDEAVDMLTLAQAKPLSRIETIFFEACRQGRRDLVKKILEGKKCNVDVRNNFDRTPMHIAASEGFTDILTFLKRHGAAIDAVDKHGMTPLFWAVYNNHRKAAMYLMGQDAKTTHVTKQGLTIIHITAHSNAPAILRAIYLKNKKLKMDEADMHGQTPLLVAASKGNTLLLEVFHRQNCRILHIDTHGDNALHLAARNGHVSTVQYLLGIQEAENLLEVQNKECKTPLLCAVETNQKDIVNMLLNAGADVNFSSDTSPHAIQIAARGGFHDVIDVLMDYGVDTSVVDKTGESVLHETTMANLPETIRFLASRGFDINRKNIRSQTPLTLAVEQRRTEVAEMLLLLGADREITDRDGRTPLMVSTRTPYTEITDMIIKADRLYTFKPERANEIRQALLSVPPPTVTRQMPTALARLTTEREQYKDLFNSPSITDNRTTTRTSRRTAEQPEFEHGSFIDIRMMERGISGSFSENTFTEDFVDPYSLEIKESVRLHLSTPQNLNHQESYDDNANVWNSPQLSYNGGELQRSEYKPPRGHVSFDPRGDFTDVEFEMNSFKDLRNGAGGKAKFSPVINGKHTLQHDGDAVYRVTDDQYVTNMSDIATEEYSLQRFHQHYAEEVKVLFYDIAHNGFKEDSWRQLAGEWKFKPAHIEAIQSDQSGGRDSYKNHGYRTLCIWFQGLEANESPVNQLQQALMSTGQQNLAKKVRARVNDPGKRTTGNRRECTVS